MPKLRNMYLTVLKAVIIIVMKAFIKRRVSGGEKPAQRRYTKVFPE